MTFDKEYCILQVLAHTGCIERDNQNFRAMIQATKAVRKENSEKIDYEQFEILLKDINISDFSEKVRELFVTFECVTDDSEASFFVEDDIIYLIVRIPFEEMEKNFDHFFLLVSYFLASLHVLSSQLDVESLKEQCGERFEVSADLK